MADTAIAAGFAVTESLPAAPRHSAVVRITHWINTVSFAGLVVSGFAILLAHPRFYWGETGNVGTPSIFDLPLPFVLTGQTGWGRSLHFLSAWACVLTGALYVLSGVASRLFRDEDRVYERPQRLTYAVVVCALFPAMIWTGLAMSPAVTSVLPWLATALGGQQSARTIHFFVADALFLFLLVHVTMVLRNGFMRLMRGMITGGE
jgi:thiosulfate reductase cytochrome b subunit